MTTARMETVVATDLDRTLIYSMAAIDATTTDGAVPPLVCVEMFDGKPLSYMTTEAARLLQLIRATRYWYPPPPGRLPSSGGCSCPAGPRTMRSPATVARSLSTASRTNSGAAPSSSGSPAMAFCWGHCCRARGTCGRRLGAQSQDGRQPVLLLGGGPGPDPRGLPTALDLVVRRPGLGCFHAGSKDLRITSRADQRGCPDRGHAPHRCRASAGCRRRCTRCRIPCSCRRRDPPAARRAA